MPKTKHKNKIVKRRGQNIYDVYIHMTHGLYYTWKYYSTRKKAREWLDKYESDDIYHIYTCRLCGSILQCSKCHAILPKRKLKKLVDDLFCEECYPPKTIDK